jgi:4'-phosphopantetheinyl transferase
VGVDAERTDRPADIAGLADRYFAPAESQALRSAADADRPRRFFSHWTLKESYAKALGRGLALPLNQAAFHIRDDAVEVTFAVGVDDDPARWRFALLESPAGHVVAVAADTGGRPLALRASPVALAGALRRPA